VNIFSDAGLFLS